MLLAWLRTSCWQQTAMVLFSTGTPHLVACWIKSRRKTEPALWRPSVAITTPMDSTSLLEILMVWSAFMMNKPANSKLSTREVVLVLPVTRWRSTVSSSLTRTLSSLVVGIRQSRSGMSESLHPSEVSLDLTSQLILLTSKMVLSWPVPTRLVTSWQCSPSTMVNYLITSLGMTVTSNLLLLARSTALSSWRPPVSTSLLEDLDAMKSRSSTPSMPSSLSLKSKSSVAPYLVLTSPTKVTCSRLAVETELSVSSTWSTMFEEKKSINIQSVKFLRGN